MVCVVTLVGRFTDNLTSALEIHTPWGGSLLFPPCLGSGDGDLDLLSIVLSAHPWLSSWIRAGQPALSPLRPPFRQGWEGNNQPKLVLMGL